MLPTLGFLHTHSNRSDRDGVAHAQVTVACRSLRNLARTDSLPHPSVLTVFRARVGETRYAQLCAGVVAHARAHGLVKDRVRLNDATPSIATSAIPATIRLVAQLRQRLLAAAEPFAVDQVTAERAHALAIRTATADRSAAERLLQRVTHLRQIVAGADQVSSHLGPLPHEPSPARRACADALALAHPILADRDDPDGGDHVVRVHDGDARRGTPGAYFTGSLRDGARDADRQISTARAVLPDGGDEAADATRLIAREATAHATAVPTLSIDKAGVRGAVLRAWPDPDGLNRAVVVPPTHVDPRPAFTAADCTHAADQRALTGPGAVTTTRRTRNRVDTGGTYVCPRNRGATGPLQDRCRARLPTATGRMGVSNEYAAAYAAARPKATTPRDRQVRRAHPASERKLAELVWHHDGRWAR